MCVCVCVCVCPCFSILLQDMREYILATDLSNHTGIMTEVETITPIFDIANPSHLRTVCRDDRPPLAYHFFRSISCSLNTQNSPPKWGRGVINRVDVCISRGKNVWCGLYSSAAYTPARLVLQRGLYSSVAYTPVLHGQLGTHYSE